MIFLKLLKFLVVLVYLFIHLLSKLRIIPDKSFFSQHFEKVHSVSKDEPKSKVKQMKALLIYLCLFIGCLIILLRFFYQDVWSSKFNYITYNFTFVERLNGKINALLLGFALISIYYNKLMGKTGLVNDWIEQVVLKSEAHLFLYPYVKVRAWSWNNYGSIKQLPIVTFCQLEAFWLRVAFQGLHFINGKNTVILLYSILIINN